MIEGLIMGSLMLLLSICMFMLRRLAIIISMFLAGLVVIFSVLILVFNFHYFYFYGLVLVIGILYLVSSKNYLWPSAKNT